MHIEVVVHLGQCFGPTIHFTGSEFRLTYFIFYNHYSITHTNVDIHTQIMVCM